MFRRQIFELFLKSTGVCTDSRQIKTGQIFFALRGENFNGNDFARSVIDQGATLAVTDFSVSEHPQIIRVENVLNTLQDLAADYRSTILKCPVFAITGSNGKTTSKELLRDVLGRRYNVSATIGNLNNHIGIPLTILSIPAECELAVIEMGANHCNEIADYCKYVKPTHGYITNIGLAHLEGFGGEAGVLKGKTELFDFIGQNEGVIFGDIHQPKMSIALFGREFISTSTEDVGIEICAEDPFISYRVQKSKAKVSTRFAGNYNIMNIAAAVRIGRYFDVPEDQIHDAIAAYVPDSNRSQIFETKCNRVIMDAYNANPTSMEHALRSFSMLSSVNKIVILGDMKELGDESLSYHQRIVDLTEELNLKSIFVGEHFIKCRMLSVHLGFAKREELVKYLQRNPLVSATILLKGSRGMRMESVVQYL